ncbi:MAG: hypothetical protein K2Q26_10445 [Bdellovibrionales bacterium]|nr:hypothetical protein [Bdellovibrionales bacterium]
MKRERRIRIGIVASIAVALVLFQNCSKGYKNRAPTSLSSSTRASNTTDESTSTSSESSAALSSPVQQAVMLYQRLSGVTLSTDDSKITAMASDIKNRQYRRAAEKATDSKEFYSLTVRDMAAAMSTRDLSPAAPLSDFVATIIGVVRDELPATELLTGNYYYRARGQAGVDDSDNAIINSNKHYLDLEARNLDYKNVLLKETQRVFSPGSTTATNQPDPAGLMTTRAWMFAHANAGTNRRLIEYTFKVFMCSPIKEWANTTYPDSHVGREIGRFPNADYKSKCKGCHTAMDGMRPATAHFDFLITDAATEQGHIKYNATYNTDPTASGGTVAVPPDERQVPSKFRRASETFPAGYAVKDDNWINYINPSQFGWEEGDGPMTGSGMNDFGKMISQARGYSQCWVKRVFNTVCKRELTAENQQLIDKLAASFEFGGYNLKDLFIDVSIRPECLALESL